MLRVAHRVANLLAFQAPPMGRSPSPDFHFFSKSIKLLLLFFIQNGGEFAIGFGSNRLDFRSLLDPYCIQLPTRFRHDFLETLLLIRCQLEKLSQPLAFGKRRAHVYSVSGLRNLGSPQPVIGSCGADNAAYKKHCNQDS